MGASCAKVAGLSRGYQNRMVRIGWNMNSELTPRERTIIDDHMQNGYFRYEVARRLNVWQFGVIFERNILLGVRFDYMIDCLRDLTHSGQVDQINAWARENHSAKCKEQPHANNPE